MNLTRNGLIVLISVIFVAGAGIAYAGIGLPNTITFAGNTHTTGNAVVDGNLDVGDSMTVTTASSIQGLSVANSFGFNAKGVSSSVTSPTGLTFGVFGQSFSPSGTGVRGDVINPSGETYGVYGSVNSPEGFGLFTPDNAHVGGDLSVSGTIFGFALGVPIGTVLPFAGTTAPTGFMLADGTAINRVTFSELFGIIGTTYGVGDGSTKEVICPEIKPSSIGQQERNCALYKIVSNSDKGGTVSGKESSEKTVLSVSINVNLTSPPIKAQLII